ncbi:PqqD family protein [Blastococcus sp. TF02A-35]|uniref:PqqD family protein n=1 Tax=Blastococcus sp. TF02A-35 TaxID=2559612 RepID=UPI00142F66A9|nr:PqqD family protein [Blastococcus sp. TF02A_35]
MEKPEKAFDARVSAQGDTLLLVRRGEAYELDAVAGLIWRHCDGTKTVEDIATVIAAEYDVSLDDAKADARELVAQLARMGLVE